MPSKSPKQHRFMEAIAHNPGFAHRAGVPQSVGQEFAGADASQPPHFALGGMNNVGALQMAGPELLGGVRPGTPNPRMPLQHPMSGTMSGLQGMMQLADHHVMGNGPRLHQMQSFAKGGRAGHSLGHHGTRAVHHAIHHLKNGNHQAAIAALQSSQDALAHPEVQQALSQLSAMGGGGGDPNTGGPPMGAPPGGGSPPLGGGGGGMIGPGGQ